MSDNNIWTDEWDPAEEDWSGGGVVSKRLPRAVERPGLGLTLYELDPGDFVVYHFHHAWEELLVVLRGEPTLRQPSAPPLPSKQLTERRRPRRSHGLLSSAAHATVLPPAIACTPRASCVHASSRNKAHWRREVSG